MDIDLGLFDRFATKGTIDHSDRGIQLRSEGQYDDYYQNKHAESEDFVRRRVGLLAICSSDLGATYIVVIDYSVLEGSPSAIACE
jgi:hypothetical protein